MVEINLWSVLFYECCCLPTGKIEVTNIATLFAATEQIRLVLRHFITFDLGRCNQIFIVQFKLRDIKCPGHEVLDKTLNFVTKAVDCNGSFFLGAKPTFSERFVFELQP